MKNLQLQYESTCLIDKQKLLQAGQKLLPELERIKTTLKHGYETEYASFNLVQDRDLVKTVAAAAHEKKKLSLSSIVLIGIGGSNLGTMAAQEAVLGTLYNLCANCIKIFYAHTIDSDYIAEILMHVERDLKQGGNVLLNVVTKSGTTTETIANFEVFLELLKRYRPDYAKYIVATTDKNSPLWHLAQNNHWTVLEVPKNVGGRYSVFSAVGLFPLALLGVDIEQLRDGARTLLQGCLDQSIEHNPAALSALIKYIHYQQKITINDLFLFSVSLESIGKWYRQLMGESIGKEYAKNGQKVEVGITPTVSIGSTDLHSVGQLYLAGPSDKFTTFVTLEKMHTKLAVPNFPEFNDCVPHIQQKPLAHIMDAIVRGTKQAYQQKQRPFCSLILSEKSPFMIGQFLQLFMCEMVYLAYLLEVNPFDQPGVELYKQQTREILAYE